jgi:hypothetical protein
MVLAHCILGKFLGVGCLEVPTFSARCLHVQWRERPLAAEGGTLRRREMFRQISSRIRLPPNSIDLLHAANRRHWTDGFTSPPKECVLRIFSPLKIRRLRPGLNPRTWVPKASTLRLDHWSRLRVQYVANMTSSNSYRQIIRNRSFSVCGKGGSVDPSSDDPGFLNVKWAAGWDPYVCSTSD